MTYPSSSAEASTESNQTSRRSGQSAATQTSGRNVRLSRVSTETKSAFKTTELLAYLGTVIAIATASQLIGTDSGAADDVDYFRADKAFLYITIVTVGYLLSRGLAKSGSRDFYDEDDN